MFSFWKNMSATSCLRYFMEDLFFGCSALCCFKLFPKTMWSYKEHKIFTVRAVVVSVITIVWWYFAEIYVTNNFFINTLMHTQKLFVFVCVQSASKNYYTKHSNKINPFCTVQALDSEINLKTFSKWNRNCLLFILLASTNAIFCN